MDSELHDVFARLGVEALEAVASAREEARALRHGHTGTEHILLGVLREESAPAMRVLNSFHVTQSRARAQIKLTVGSGSEQIAGEIPFTPRATRALQFALSEAIGLRHERVTTDDLLLGLIRSNDGAAIRILSELDAEPAKIRAELIRRTGKSEQA